MRKEIPIPQPLRAKLVGLINKVEGLMDGARAALEVPVGWKLDLDRGFFFDPKERENGTHNKDSNSPGSG